ncbi:Gfo/Idh/MocA family oxidoreductase [soil metagenome]
MTKTLNALILGSGYAGEGHTMALQRAGVNVVAMASRTLDVCQRMAAKLNIPRAGTDWRSMIAEIKPDIVAVGTPGGTHLEMITAALEAGANVLCDKPLATTAQDARAIYQLAKEKGLKTAYAASYRYQPQTLYARELVKQGVLGTVCEVECVSHYKWPALMPFGWPHRLDMGGGRLNNNFTHKLAIVQNIVGGEILAAMGECRNDLKRVPVAEKVHDFREYMQRTLSPEAADRGEWATVHSDWSYTVLTQLGDRAAERSAAVTATFRHSALRTGKNADYVAIYGEKGTLHTEGAYMQGAMFLCTDGDTWDEVAVPDAIRAALPPEPDHSQRNWDQLVREFVADLRGEGNANYQTFRDGWIYQEVIDIVRAGSGWTTVAADL